MFGLLFYAQVHLSYDMQIPVDHHDFFVTSSDGVTTSGSTMDNT
jgi:hypothetical protein